MSSSERTDCSVTQPRPGARPYLRVPIDLIVRYRSRPAVIGIYASIARLNAIYKCAVDVSRTDFACWCGIEPDALAGCTKRAIGDLKADGWIIKETGEGGKLRLLAAWGKGADGQARPFRPDNRDRGKPSRARFVTLPLDLFDLYLGRLTPNTHDQAKVDRYFDRALLTFADIGMYAVRQLATVPPTPRLTCLGLAPNLAPDDTSDIADFPSLADLLQQAARGDLRTCDDAGTPITVALSPIGTAKLHQFVANTPTFSDDRRGSATDRTKTLGRSPSGSSNLACNSASGSDVSQNFPDSGATWDEDGITNQLRIDPSSKDLQHAHESATTATVYRHNDQKHQHPPEEQTIGNLPTPPPEQFAAASENNHILALDPMITGWHRALNPGREIANAELFALLDLQQRHGAEALRRWLFRATNAGKTYVLPSYYEACAATDAFAVVGTSWRAKQPTGVDMPSETRPNQRRQARLQRPAVPVRSLDAECAALVHDIEERAGRTIRRPEKLADAPVDLLTRWRDISGHPGLLARWEIGYLVSEIAKGHEPPTLDELNSWAEVKGISSYDPRLAPFRTLSQDDQSSTPSDSQNFDSRDECDNVVSELIQPNASPSAGLWQDVLQALSCQTDLPSFRTWLRHARLLTLTDCLAVIGVPSVANKDAIERKYTHSIRELLREQLGRTVDIRIVIAPSAPLHQPPPDWIDKTIWQQLDAEFRAALAGSSLGPDGLNVRADVYELLCTCYAAPMHALLERAQA